MATADIGHHFNFRHGQSGGKSSLYGIWQAMKNRCRNPNQTHWHRYGGRGIGYCAEWETFEAFRSWALENGYQNGLSIDRIDNDGNYEPSNCRWIEKAEQARNTSRCIWVVYQGQRMILKDAARAAGVNYGTVVTRVRSGIAPEDALTMGRAKRRWKVRPKGADA